MTHATSGQPVNLEKAKKSATHKHKAARMPPANNGEILVKGVVMGLVISGITHTSNSITKALLRHPLGLFSTGLLTGYLTHKYRKQIITLGNRTAVESKNFVLRQKEHLGDLISEIKAEGQDN